MMSDDDLEYYIKFPAPAPPNVGNDDFVFVFDGDREPVVFLLGWAGCRDMHLAKYSQIYEERGCITIRYTPPVEYVVWYRDQIAPLAVRLVNLVSEMSLEEHPIFFHIFSNGGAFLYSSICQVLEQTRPGWAIHGTIFDSGPAPRSIRGTTLAMSAIVRERYGKRWFASFLVMALAVFFAFQLSWHNIKDIFCPRQNWYNFLKQQKPMHPQLYFFSKDDRIIPWQKVQKLAEYRRQLGAKVATICFDSSPHVQHLRLHREAYVENAYSFLRICLSAGDNESQLRQTLPDAHC